MKQIRLRTPLTYYGGKQQMIKIIEPMIPTHNLYCEPFCGGAAIFFGKEPSNVEILNDTNAVLQTFYRVVKTDFPALKKRIDSTLHSREMHNDAWIIYNEPHMFNDVDKAWAVWVLANMSYTSRLNGSFAYERSSSKISDKVQHKKDELTIDIARRLEHVQIECADACYIIQSRDCHDSFFYCDPPYINTCQGHYDGYTETDYENLLINLSKIEGKFLLSSFPTDLLTHYTQQHGWNTKQFDLNSSASGSRKRKIEVLTANYTI